VVSTFSAELCRRGTTRGAASRSRRRRDRAHRVRDDPRPLTLDELKREGHGLEALARCDAAPSAVLDDDLLVGRARRPRGRGEGPVGADRDEIIPARQDARRGAPRTARELGPLDVDAPLPPGGSAADLSDGSSMRKPRCQPGGDRRAAPSEGHPIRPVVHDHRRPTRRRRAARRRRCARVLQASVRRAVRVLTRSSASRARRTGRR
jgi:hypothetical protein